MGQRLQLMADPNKKDFETNRDKSMHALCANNNGPFAKISRDEDGHCELAFSCGDNETDSVFHDNGRFCFLLVSPVPAFRLHLPLHP